MKLITGEHYFGIPACSSCGMPILLNETNRETTDEGKYRVTCSNVRCRHPTNDYEPKEVEHFQATEALDILS
jgi:hypothetical protein